MTTFALDISSTIPRISHSVMHKQSCLLLLLGPSVHHKSVHQSISPSVHHKSDQKIHSTENSSLTMDPSFICDTCGKTFKTKQSMKQHIRNCHEADKEYPCEECNENFTGKRKWLNHKQTFWVPSMIA